MGYTFAGDSPGDRFGRSVSGAGDVNGDGVADLIVGAYLDDNNGNRSGSARVFSGSDGAVLFTFFGDNEGDSLGASVGGAGDVNGDGFSDLIVGMNLDDNTGRNSGSARVYSGANGAELFTFNGASADDQFGFSVGGAGDVNGDGFADVIVGAQTADRNGAGSGSARVLSGTDGSVLYDFDGRDAGGQFGFSVGGAGDVNGDGFADVIVGANSEIINGERLGSAQVLSGADGAGLFTFTGDAAGDSFGISVNGAGDVNGDGFNDLIVGANGNDANDLDSGSARVLSGRDGAALFTFNGEVQGDRFGTSVSGVGDVNGDGFADLIVGAPGADPNDNGSGNVRVFSGFDGSELLSFDGDGGFDGFGVSVSDLGDLNGDGIADFVVGAEFGGANAGGYARVFVSVPEPATATLLAVFAAGLLGRRRR